MTYSQMVTDSRVEFAKGIFAHYFRRLYEKAGLTWCDDNQTEIENAIDQLLMAALEIAKERDRRG